MNTELSVSLVIISMILSAWVGYKLGKTRAAPSLPQDIQTELDLNQIRRQAEGIHRVGDEFSHYQAYSSSVGRVRERPRTQPTEVVGDNALDISTEHAIIDTYSANK